VDLRDRDQARLADREQSLRYHLGRLMGFLDHSGFLQIEPGTKSLSRASQNENAFLWIGARSLECGG
jgi:hypothetical protein